MNTPLHPFSVFQNIFVNFPTQNLELAHFDPLNPEHKLLEKVLEDQVKMSSNRGTQQPPPVSPSIADDDMLADPFCTEQLVRKLSNKIKREVFFVC